MANRADAFLDAVRTRLLTVPTLPATRAWMNTKIEPSSTAAFVSDSIVTWDTEPRELGVDAWQRTQTTYRVAIRVPRHTGTHSALSIAIDVEDAFRATPLSVSGNEMSLMGSRKGPVIEELSHLMVPVYLDLQFDHA